MLDTLKSLWAKWKVHVTVVGGALVVATVYGTCVYTPSGTDQAESVEVSVEPSSNTATEAAATEAAATEAAATEAAATTD